MLKLRSEDKTYLNHLINFEIYKYCQSHLITFTEFNKVKEIITYFIENNYKFNLQTY